MTEAKQPLSVLFLTPNAVNNSLGRTWCLWLLARSLGWTTRVAAVKGEQLWPPLATGEFADDCRILTGLGESEREAELDRLAAEADVIIAVKPLPTSFGLGLRLVGQAPLPRPLSPAGAPGNSACSRCELCGRRPRSARRRRGRASGTPGACSRPRWPCSGLQPARR